MTAQISWYASPGRCRRTTTKHARDAFGAEQLLRMLQDADAALTRRSGNGKRHDEPDVQIYVEGADSLLRDARHGKQIRDLANKLTIHGHPVGIRLKLAW